MKLKLFYVAVVTCVVLMFGCARQDYRRVEPDIHLVTKERLSVGVQDLRPYIIKHDKEENFVGIQRGAFGIPGSLITQSTHPLAEDMTDALVKSFENMGATVIPMKISPAMDMGSVLQIARTQQSDKIVLLTLLDWETDTFQSTDLIYNISMTVFDSKGHEVAKKQLQGTDNLGKDVLNPQSIPIELAPIAFQHKLEELFRDDISTALSKNH